MHTKRHRVGQAVAVLFATIVLAASCASGSTDDATTIRATADVSKLGPADAATGTPVKIGYITEGKTAAVDTAPEEAAAKAAVTYVNEHLGGIKGHPLELELCYSQLTPAGASDCANKMIAAKVPVVLAATPAVPAPISTALEAAGIPYFVDVVVDQAAILSPNTYALANILGFTAAPVEVAKAGGHTKVATILIDVPAAVGPIKALGQPLYDKAGISNEFVAVPPGTPDMTPQIQSALSKDPQMFTVVGDPAFCTAGLGALHTLGFTGTVFINAQCLSDGLASSVPGGLKGVKVGATESLDNRDEEVAVYEAVMARYAPDTPPHATNTPAGYAIVLAFARAMDAGLQGDVTPSSVKAAFESAPAQPMPLMAGQTFQCNRKQFKLTPSICSTAIVVSTMTEDGKVESSTPIDTKKYFDTGS